MLNSAPRKISIVWAAARYLALVWASIFVPCFFASSKVLGGQERGQTPDISIVPKPINDTFDSTRIHNANKNAPPEQQTAEVQDSCLLPPLTLILKSGVNPAVFDRIWRKSVKFS